MQIVGGSIVHIKNGEKPYTKWVDLHLGPMQM